MKPHQYFLHFLLLPSTSGKIGGFLLKRVMAKRPQWHIKAFQIQEGFSFLWALHVFIQSKLAN